MVTGAASNADAAVHYLHTHSVLSLATTQGGQPWVSPVFYVVWRGSLVFLSAPHTRHVQNFTVNPLVSASVQEDYKDWEKIKGLQLEGSVQLIEAQYLHDAIQCYAEKFPVTGSSAPPAIKKALDKIRWYQLKPSLVYYIDNSQGFGHREEVCVSRI